MTRAIIVASAVVLFLFGFAAIIATVASNLERDELFAGSLQKRDEPEVASSVLPSLPLLQAAGDLIPNSWSIAFRTDAPMDEIVSTIEGSTSCTIRGKYTDVQLLSVTCPPFSLPSLLLLVPVLQYGVYYEPELNWRPVQTQSNAPWGLDRTDQRNLPLSGTYNPQGYDGNTVDAHILDTGVFAGHTDFGGRVRAGYDAVQDGNATTTDCHGHGTHVAGTVGGTTSGLAKKVNIYASRVLGCDGSGSTTGIVAAIRWVASQNTGRRKVINMSLGGGTSSSLDSAVADATSKGIVVVVAAGNENQDACNVSPARAPSAITVMASDRSDARASFSNFGTCTDVVAPGVNILSNSNTDPNGRVVMSGTSMASPRVAGIVALVLQAYPSYNVQQVTDYLLSISTPNKISGLSSGSPNKLLFWAAPSDPTPSCATSSPATSSPATSSPATSSPATSSPAPSTQPPFSGGTREQGSISQGQTVYVASYSTSNGGTHQGYLVGPSNSDFDLYLQKQGLLGWQTVASDAGSSSTKSLSYTGSSSLFGQSFRYAITATRGSGSYTLTSTKP